MSENHTANIFQILIDRTIGQGNSITLREALAANMPRGVKGFLQAEAAGWLERDLRAMPRFARLNINTPGADHLMKTLLRSMAGGYVFSREEYLAALNEAVLFVENYLCRPQWTLDNFVFHNAPRLSRDAILGRLEFLADYAYFPRVLERVLRTGKRSELTVEDFRALVARIDDQVVSQHSPRELAILTRPIFGFFLLHEAGDDQPIPLKPVLIFFDDKKMKILTEYLESICRLRGASTITLNDLIRLLEDLYIGKEPEGPPPEAPASLRPSEGDRGHSMAEGGTESDRTAELPAAEEGATPQEQTGGETGERTVSTPSSEEIDIETVRELPDLTGLISPDQRARFIRRVFGKDQAYFYGVVATLNTMRTWKEAASYLKQVYEINRLDPFAPDVVEFTDTVQKRFAAEEETSE
jgi:hypothetical protein